MGCVSSKDSDPGGGPRHHHNHHHRKDPRQHRQQAGGNNNRNSHYDTNLANDQTRTGGGGGGSYATVNSSPMKINPASNALRSYTSPQPPQDKSVDVSANKSSASMSGRPSTASSPSDDLKEQDMHFRRQHFDRNSVLRHSKKRSKKGAQSPYSPKKTSVTRSNENSDPNASAAAASGSEVSRGRQQRFGESMTITHTAAVDTNQQQAKQEDSGKPEVSSSSRASPGREVSVVTSSNSHRCNILLFYRAFSSSIDMTIFQTGSAFSKLVILIYVPRNHVQPGLPHSQT